MSQKDLNIVCLLSKHVDTMSLALTNAIICI